MVFTKRLREGVRRGEITCSVRIWQRPHVTVGSRYPMDEGSIEIRRMDYDIPKAQKKILDAGLPPRLAERLAHGK